MTSQIVVWLLIDGKLTQCLVEGIVADRFLDFDHQIKQANRLQLVKGASVLTRKRTKYAAEVVELGHYKKCY